jgi:hypothetical protein
LKERRPDNTMATLFVFKLASGFVPRTPDKNMKILPGLLVHVAPIYCITGKISTATSSTQRP